MSENIENIFAFDEELEDAFQQWNSQTAQEESRISESPRDPDWNRIHNDDIFGRTASDCPGAPLLRAIPDGFPGGTDTSDDSRPSHGVRFEHGNDPERLRGNDAGPRGRSRTNPCGSVGDRVPKRNRGTPVNTGSPVNGNSFLSPECQESGPSRERRSKRPSTNARWFFTMNFAGETPEKLKEVGDSLYIELKKKCKSFMFQLEKAETGTLHFQGCLWLLKKGRPFNDKECLVSPLLWGAHWQGVKDWAKSVKYCSKDETSMGHRWSHNVEGMPINITFHLTTADPIKTLRNLTKMGISFSRSQNTSKSKTTGHGNENSSSTSRKSQTTEKSSGSGAEKGVWESHPLSSHYSAWPKKKISETYCSYLERRLTSPIRSSSTSTDQQKTSPTKRAVLLSRTYHPESAFVMSLWSTKTTSPSVPSRS